MPQVKIKLQLYKEYRKQMDEKRKNKHQSEDGAPGK